MKTIEFYAIVSPVDIQKQEHSSFRTVIGLIGVGLGTMLWSIFFVSSRLLFFPKSLVDANAYAYSQFLIRCVNVRVQVHRRELFNDDTPCVVVSNHSSILDIPAVFGATSGRLRMLSKREMFFVPFLGWSMWATRFVAINRGNSRSGRRAIHALADRLQRGFHIFLAPEGTRSPSGALLPFKNGAFRIAMEHKVPLVVIVLERPWELLRKGSLWPKYSGVIHATFVARIEPADFPKKPDELAARARKSMLEHGLKDNC